MIKDYTKDEFDIIIQAGQSNAEGCGQGNVPEPYVHSNNIYYTNWGNGILTSLS